jgi:hypothetical protein
MKNRQGLPILNGRDQLVDEFHFILDRPNASSLISPLPKFLEKKDKEKTK